MHEERYSGQQKKKNEDRRATKIPGKLAALLQLSSAALLQLSSVNVLRGFSLGSSFFFIVCTNLYLHKSLYIFTEKKS